MGSDLHRLPPIITSQNPRKVTRREDPLKYLPAPPSTGAIVMGGKDEKTKGWKLLPCTTKDKKPTLSSAPPQSPPPPYGYPVDANVTTGNFQHFQPWSFSAPNGAFYLGEDKLRRTVQFSNVPQALGWSGAWGALSTTIPTPAPSGPPVHPPTSKTSHAAAPGPSNLDRFNNMSPEEQEKLLEAMHHGCAVASSATSLPTANPPAADPSAADPHAADPPASNPPAADPPAANPPVGSQSLCLGCGSSKQLRQHPEIGTMCVPCYQDHYSAELNASVWQE